MADPDLLFQGLLTLGAIAAALGLVGSVSRSQSVPKSSEPEPLRLLAPSHEDFQKATFDQLRSLLISYPSILHRLTLQPDLPAKNLAALFVALDNLLQSWEYESIGSPWAQVTFDPQIHQPDRDDIQPGELVYIRFVGYRHGETILAPAKVSRSLPPLLPSSAPSP